MQNSNSVKMIQWDVNTNTMVWRSLPHYKLNTTSNGINITLYLIKSKPTIQYVHDLRTQKLQARAS